MKLDHRNVDAVSAHRVHDEPLRRVAPAGPPRGVTLMELMITIAIVAILASVALPSYQTYIKRANRADAKATLLEMAQFLERNFTETSRYDLGGNGETIPLPVTVSPREGTALYNISRETANTGTTFTLKATPIDGQAMAGDECGTLTLTNTGQKGVSGATSSAAECWQR